MTLDTQAALAAARDLRQLAAEERSLIAAGRLDELDQLAQRRAALVGTLTGLLPEGDLPPGPLRQELQEVEQEARQTLALLCALRDEIAGRLEQDRRVQHAAGAYISNL